MMIQLLKSKIMELLVTESHINYPGSISIPEELLIASGIRQFELVHVNNKTNGNRILTYAVINKEKGKVTINGAASRLFQKGDLIHVLSYAFMDENEAATFIPALVIADQHNNLVETKPYSFD